MLYEANPILAILEQAGRKAINGFELILDITPSTIRQSVPFFCIITKMVEKLESFLLDEIKE